MSRRRLLAGGGIAALAIGGGWYFFLRETTPGGPEGVVYEMADAIESGDSEAMQQLIHEDSPNQERLMGEVGSDGSGNLSIDIESTEVVNREDATGQPDVQEFVTVETRATVTFEIGGETQSDTNTSNVVVAMNPDGEWKLWASN